MSIFDKARGNHRVHLITKEQDGWDDFGNPIYVTARTPWRVLAIHSGSPSEVTVGDGATGVRVDGADYTVVGWAPPGGVPDGSKVELPSGVVYRTTGVPREWGADPFRVGAALIEVELKGPPVSP